MNNLLWCTYTIRLLSHRCACCMVIGNTVGSLYIIWGCHWNRDTPLISRTQRSVPATQKCKSTPSLIRTGQAMVIKDVRLRFNCLPSTSDCQRFLSCLYTYTSLNAHQCLIIVLAPTYTTHYEQESFFQSDAALLGQPRTLGWIEDLCLFRHLVSLSLSDNCLEQFPLSLCNLKSLQELDVSSNNLRNIPQEIQNLTRWDVSLINCTWAALHLTYPAKFKFMCWIKLLVL